jgi:hypothetical protein
MFRTCWVIFRENFFVIVTLRLHFIVEWECAVDCVLEAWTLCGRSIHGMILTQRDWSTQSKAFPTATLPIVPAKGPECKLSLFTYRPLLLNINLVQKTWVCDGIKDCSRGEDETKCEPTCEDNQFRCGNVSGHESLSVTSRSTITCIGKKHVCDGKRDCPRGEGETRNYHSSLSASHRVSTCCWL